MVEKFSKTELLLGKEAMQKLAASRVAVFGLGGVGGYTVEALARSGIGALDLIDGDTVSVSNFNRQIIATDKTLGKSKAEAAKERVLLINSNCNVISYQVYFLPENASDFDFTKYDYIVDAVDNVTAKLTIAELAAKCRVPVISCMGAGNKLDATAFEISDIYKTSVCPLAKVMRRELKKRGVDKLKVVYSKEQPSKFTTENGQRITASVAFVPSVAGLILAGEVIKDLSLCNKM